MLVLMELDFCSQLSQNKLLCGADVCGIDIALECFGKTQCQLTKFMGLLLMIMGLKSKVQNKLYDH